MLFFIPPYTGFATSAASQSYTAGTTDTANTTNYSFGTVALGAAASDRLIALSVVEGSTGGSNPTSVTIGGISASIVGSVTSGPVTQSLWAAAVPTGTTATILVNNAGTRQFCRIDVFRIVGQASNTAYYSNTAFNAGSSTVLTLTPGYVLADGATIACSAAPASDPSYTWVGLTEAYDVQAEAGNARVSGASGAGFSTPITATTSASVTGLMGIIAMWR